MWKKAKEKCEKVLVVAGDSNPGPLSYDNPQLPRLSHFSFILLSSLPLCLDSLVSLSFLPEPVLLSLDSLLLLCLPLLASQSFCSIHDCRLIGFVKLLQSLLNALLNFTVLTWSEKHNSRLFLNSLYSNVMTLYSLNSW